MTAYHIKYYRKVKIDPIGSGVGKGEREIEIMETIAAENIRLAIDYWKSIIDDPGASLIGIYVGEPVLSVLKEKIEHSA